MVSDSNIRLYSSFYEILRQGESLELMPNSKWFLWAERDRYRKRPQNLVYDEEAIKRERDRRKEPNKSEWERRTTIENTLKSSDLFRDPTFMVADLELCLRVGTLMRNRNLTESALEMCLSAPAVLQRIEDLIQDWRKTSTQE
jgi:hypothetical protein